MTAPAVPFCGASNSERASLHMRSLCRMSQDELQLLVLQTLAERVGLMREKAGLSLIAWRQQAR